MTVKTKTIEAVPGNFSRELQQIFAEVVLGRSSAKCKHLGICKIENAWTNNFLDYMQATVENRLYGLASLKGK
ncbi:MAG: hypothetical protein IPH16_13755 [Haliscomenobacter sp.]|nr:hypothetical protein [Haliscomenobacter sp.]